MPSPISMAMIGCGGMARHHLRQILKQQDTTQITCVAEPSPEAYAVFAALYTEAGLTPPPNEPNLEKLLARYQPQTAFIITPHAYHYEQTRLCLEAGLDVLLEKPMVMNAQEALDLMGVRDRTGKLLVVAFPGSLSPYLRAAVDKLRSGTVGAVLSISATIWQNWGQQTLNTWRQEPAIAGGGFFFDTGAHMLNTVVELAGEPFVEVAAWLDDQGRPVETMGVVIGRLASGALVTLHGCGEAIPSCASDIKVFTEQAILRTGMWGEFLELQRAGEPQLAPVSAPPSLGVWEQFLLVRAGQLPNPAPPEVGLRMARLYDAIVASAARHGAVVALSTA
ncbi:MAG: Gfo/Idh/MocA family oxidoreductase [Anaerolineales bacterium]|nr:Gfo/Idh/MocA family oxidoreductase [Anaerolineales bacterium]